MQDWVGREAFVDSKHSRRIVADNKYSLASRKRVPRLDGAEHGCCLDEGRAYGSNTYSASTFSGCPRVGEKLVERRGPTAYTPLRRGITSPNVFPRRRRAMGGMNRPRAIPFGEIFKPKSNACDELIG